MTEQTERMFYIKLNKFSKLGILCLGFMLNLILNAKAFSHPHAWIEYIVEPKINSENKVVGLLQTWKFDPYYSVFLLEEQRKMGDKQSYQERLTKLGNFMLNNMARVNYFTQIENTSVKKAQLRYLHDKSSRMLMQFYLPFTSPITAGQILKYKVFDPTYYIDMQHDKKQQMKFHAWNLKIVKANPSQKTINKALALDTSATPSEKLGILFTDTGILKCKK